MTLQIIFLAGYLLGLTEANTTGGSWEGNYGEGSSWQLERSTSGVKTYVSFSAISNDPPMFPRYLQDPVVIRMFHNNLVNLKKMLDERK